jgi:hypothetical protein
MSRTILITALTLFFFASNGQHFKNYLRCEVKSTLLKVPLTNGEFSEWRPIGDLDSAVQSNIIFDFNKMRIIWDVRSKKHGNNIEDSEEIFEIEKINEDSTYSDFGFTSLKIEARNDKKMKIDYELIGFAFEDCGHLFLIQNDKNFKSKQELIVN